MTAIELTDVSKHFGDVVAVRDLDLTVEEGEIFGFLGPNGAGKSTTIDMMLDFVRPTAGEVRVLGFDAQREGVALRQRTGVLPDAYHLYDRLTGRQHVEFAIESKGSDEDPIELLGRVGIAEAADRKAGGYSKGMRQRLVLAMALVGDPELLILDEPSTGLDPNGAREMRDLIRTEAESGTTVFFSSHILEQVEAVCDRVGILNRGELVAVDTIAGLRQAVEPETTLEVSVSGASEDSVEAVQAVEGVKSASLTDGTMHVTLLEGSKLPALNALEDAGVTVHDFTIETSSLDDLFAAYTSEKQEVEA